MIWEVLLESRGRKRRFYCPRCVFVQPSSASASGSWRPTRHRFGVEVVADEHIIMGNETAIYLRNRWYGQPIVCLVVLMHTSTLRSIKCCLSLDSKLHRYVIKSSGAQSLSIYWEKFTMPPTGVFMVMFRAGVPGID